MLVDEYDKPILEALDVPAVARMANRDYLRGLGVDQGIATQTYDVLLLLRRRKFGAHWFETGTPAVLVETLFRRRVASVSLSGLLGTEELLSAFDVDHIGTEALLFQTGYLTILSEQDLAGEPVYRLGYPNREVRQSLNRSLLSYLVQDASQSTKNRMRLSRLLAANDFDGMKELFHAFFAGIPYQWYTNNDIAEYEGFYASVFYSYFAALGYDIAVEESSSHARLDMAVRTGGHVYLFEFKVVGDGAAGIRARAVAAAPLRRQVPRPRRADPPDRRRVQPRHPQPDRVRSGRRLRQKRPVTAAGRGPGSARAGSGRPRGTGCRPVARSRCPVRGHRRHTLGPRDAAERSGDEPKKRKNWRGGLTGILGLVLRAHGLRARLRSATSGTAQSARSGACRGR